jgi:RimJ/RimL family protein N-acetyltransferase
MRRLPSSARTARLALRLLADDDAALMLAVLNDPDFIANVGDRGVRSLEDARRYVRQGAIASHESLGLGVYRLDIRATGDPAGICGLFKRNWLQCPDVGFALLPAHRARGYAREATEAVMSLGFSTLHLPRIAAITAADNTGSIRVLERAGLRLEGLVHPPGEAEPLRLFLKEAP